jgi:hypothetical protein
VVTIGKMAFGNSCKNLSAIQQSDQKKFELL